MQTESTILSGLATQLHTHLHNALSEKHTQHQNMEIALLFAAFLVSCITMFGLYFPASSTPKKQKKHTDHPANNQEDLLHANAPPRTVHQSLQLILLNAFDDNPAAFAIVNLLTDRIKYQNAAFKCLCETHKIHIDTLTALIYRQYENGYHNLKNFVVPIAVTAEEHNNLFMDYATYLADDKLLCSIHIGQSPRSHAAPRLIDRHVDDLTQACTRQRFVQKMSEAITMQAICVIAVDINKFADINRTYGFKSADNILIHLVQDLPHMIFGETQKADDSFIGRLDSNLFAIAYPAPKTIHTDLDTLKQRIEQAPYLDENGDAIFISVRTAHLTIHKIEDQAEKNIITEDRLQQLEMMLSRHLM
jgi:GGDEF domain-containing protein